MTGVIDYPLVTEKAMNLMDYENTLQFVVHMDANKGEVADAVESRFGVEVESVNTMVTMNGTKKATVRLGEGDDAEDVASRIGVF